MSLPWIILISILISLLGIAVLLLLLYILILVRPQGNKPHDISLLCDYAHRGLHGNGVPENSLDAFELACRAGYGIELDIQLSSDGEVVVFHDYTLTRMTGCDKKLCEVTLCELQALRLSDSDQYIPSFKEVLELVGSRVPILVELKGENFDLSLCDKASEILKEYSGKYCIESFNPLLVKKMRELLPDAFCGLLYTDVIRDKKKLSFINFALTVMGLNFLCKPNFIAYNEVDRNSLPVKLATGLYKTPKFVWTVNSRESLDKAHEYGEYPIFEKIDRK